MTNKYDIMTIPLTALSRCHDDLYWRHDRATHTAMVLRTIQTLAAKMARLLPDEMAEACEIAPTQVVETAHMRGCIAISLLTSDRVDEHAALDLVASLQAMLQDAGTILARIARSEHPERIDVIAGSGCTAESDYLIVARHGVDQIVSTLRHLRSTTDLRHSVAAELGGTPLAIPCLPPPADFMADTRPLMETVRIRGVIEHRAHACVAFGQAAVKELSYPPAIERDLILAQAERREVQITWLPHYRYIMGQRVSVSGSIIEVQPAPQLELDLPRLSDP